MATVLSTRAVELSTYQVTFAFTDEEGTAVVPTALTWTLTDAAGNVINSRSAVAVATLSASVTITLQGNDLALPAGQGNVRHLTVVGTYDSDAGSDLPLKDAAVFYIDNLVYND